MFAKRHPFLWTFVGGCLSGAALIGFLSYEAPAARENAPEARTKQRYFEPAPADDDRNSADIRDDDPAAVRNAPAAAQKAAAFDDEPQAEPGSSVADLLIRLEVAYRQGTATAPPSSTTTITTVTHTPPPEVLAHEEPAVVVAAAAPTSATETQVSPARAPESDAQPLAARDDARPRDVHIGDVDQSTTIETTNIGTVHQGDVVVVQNVVQYVPFFVPRPGRQAPPPQTRAAMPGRPNPLVPFRSTRDNPDNRSPFTYPIDLVH